jgi:hypothetical protein
MYYVKIFLIVNKMLHQPRKHKLSFILFMTSLIASFSFGNIFFLSTHSPDFLRYKTYIDFFMTDNTVVILEQGFIYFLITSFFVYLRIKDFYMLSEDALSTIGAKANFSYFDLTSLEINYNLGVQEGNFVLYLLGLIGFFKLLRLKKYSIEHIFISFSILNFFPILIQLRLSLKPEILAFSILPWLLFSIERYFKTKKFIYVVFSSIFFSILFTTKASIGLMISLFLILVYYQHLKKINFKVVISALGLCLVFIVPLMLESYEITGYSILNRADANEIYDQQEYDNTAPISFLYNLNLKELATKPISNYHANSLIGITLLDSFGDYFNLYWNQDYTLMKIDRKQFVNSDTLNNFYFNSIEDTLYIPKKYSFNFEYLRSYISLLLSFLFYGYILNKIYQKNEDYKFYLGPFIGILVLLLSSFGVPENNFNPNLGDTLKVFYYGFLVSFVFLLTVLNLIKVRKKVSLIILISLVPLFLFIFGFPKANNTYMDYSISKTNQYSLLCDLNKIPLKVMLLETQNLNCNSSVVEQACSNLESIAFKARDLVNAAKDGQDLQQYLDFDACAIKISSDSKLFLIEYQTQKIPILSLIMLILSSASILLLIFNDKFNLTKETST